MSPIRERIKKKLTNWLVEERGSVSVPLFDFERTCTSLRPGDVLLVEGCSRVSSIIRHITHSPWTHSALYVGSIQQLRDMGIRHSALDGYEGDTREPLMVESLLGEGTILAPLSKYRDNHLRVCRPIGLAEADARTVVSRVVNRLGTEYETRELLESALVMIWQNFAPRWRSRCFGAKAQRTEGTICSSMLGQAFMSVGFPVFPLIEQTREGERKRKLLSFQMLTPKDFDHSPSFEIVKCPVDLEMRNALVQTATSYEPAPTPSRQKTSRKITTGWAMPNWLKRKRRVGPRTNTSIPKTDTGPPD